MATLGKVFGPGAIDTAIAEARASADQAAQGTWRGRTITLAPAGTAAGMMERKEHERAALPAIQLRNLASRRVAAERPFRGIPAALIFQRAPTLGVQARQIRAFARAFLRGAQGGDKSGGARSGRRSSSTRHLALHLLDECLDDDVKQEEMTALLSDMGSADQSTDDPQELLEWLRGAMAGDSEEFEDYVQDILSGLDITPQDAAQYADEFLRARNDDAKLMELLQRAQQIPQLHRPQDESDRLALRERIRNEIREFENSSEGRQVLASFNAAPVAAVTADPASFLQTYIDFVTQQRTFAAALKLLLGRYPADSIDDIIDKLKKALGDDLGAATPSHDTRWLGAVLTDLGHLAMSSTLLEAVRELLGLLRRREESRRGQEHKGREDGRDDEEAEQEDEDEEGGKKDRGQTAKQVTRHGRQL
ncbi:MAG TPA: hypothetical protein VHA82_14630 [Ramlibacter sp.]|uniref:hypothetical protein n=1 Tax=Ramlibacter sp. TaxID=1917967 RepID=UPI002D16713F|nr:hypothetical protein [Ramlibacter sp.]HVZ45043.1 hypothetical protein [Ramlibacter sp.]